MNISAKQSSNFSLTVRANIRDINPRNMAISTTPEKFRRDRNSCFYLFNKSETTQIIQVNFPIIFSRVSRFWWIRRSVISALPSSQATFFD